MTQTQWLTLERLDELERKAEAAPKNIIVVSADELLALIQAARSSLWRTDWENVREDTDQSLMIAQYFETEDRWHYAHIWAANIPEVIAQGWTHFRIITPPQDGEACLTCGGTGNASRIADEAELGQQPGSAAIDCPDCTALEGER